MSPLFSRYEVGLLLDRIKIMVLANIIQERRFLLSLGYPCCRFSGLLSQEHAQLCTVLLHMTQIVQLKLRKGQLSPGEPAQPVSLFV